MMQQSSELERAVLAGSFTHAVQTTGLVLDPVETLLEHRGKLVASGTFTESGSTPTRGVARWLETRWANMGSGLTDVEGLVVWNDDLIAGGTFPLPSGGATSGR